MMMPESACPSRTALVSLPAAVRRSSAEPPSDPIMFAIKRHREAFAAFLAAPVQWAGNHFEFLAAEREAEREAAEELMATVPTTMHGVIALLDCLHGFERELPLHEWHIAFPVGFEAAVRENVRVALKALALSS
jgi:hypothetical protein